MRKKFIEQLTVLITGAFSFVAALAWNSAITELIHQYIKPGNTTVSLFSYAIIVTIIAVIVAVQLNRINEKFKK
ncbi:MAG: DUF5654 family protein [Patescibacteria group bacterium]|nr:DUF5654 family protein [Patescibacteria group bacterium]